MFKIRLIRHYNHGTIVNIIMPEEHESLFKACDRADLYKGKNPQAHYLVFDSDTGDIHYEV